MIHSYQEYKNNRHTLEVHQSPMATQVKLFDKDREVLYMEYESQTPIVVDAINILIKMINDELHQYK